MNLIKFLLLDGALLFVGFISLWILQVKKNPISFISELNRNDNIGQLPINIPNLNKLLELENIARREGSGIEFDSLLGLWKFQSVWKKETDLEDSLSSSLLRTFAASLEIRKDPNKNPQEFAITNSIHFGALSIKFVGWGELKGPQPLLPFFFESIQLTLGKNLLFKRSLEMADLNKRPFFALIGKEENNRWLAARGRGGGLAVWLKES